MGEKKQDFKALKDPERKRKFLKSLSEALNEDMHEASVKQRLQNEVDRLERNSQPK